MSARLRAMIDRERALPVEEAPRKAIPVARHYKAGLDPEAARILDMSRLGLDVAIGGPAGTGKSATIKRLRAMAAPTRSVEVRKADGSVAVDGQPDAAESITVIDEIGLAADARTGTGTQTISTFDFLQVARLARIPNWQAGRPERRSEHVIARTSYRRKSNKSLPLPSEDGGSVPFPGPIRKTSETGDRVRIHHSWPDATSTAIAIALTVIKNANVNPGVKQTVAISRPAVLDVVQDILIHGGILTSDDLRGVSVKFTHPLLIQGDEADALVLEVAGMDADGIDDAMRLAGVIMARATQQLDMVMPDFPKSGAERPGRMAMALLTHVLLPYELDFARPHDALSVPPIPGQGDRPIIGIEDRPEGIEIRLNGRPAYHSRHAIADAPFEARRSETGILLTPTNLSNDRGESVIIEALEYLHPIADPHFTKIARDKRKKKSEVDVLNLPGRRTTSAKGKKERKK